MSEVPLVATPLAPLPVGCAVPSPPGYLAQDAATGAWLLIRPVTEEIDAELRTEFLSAARAVAAAPQAGLLNVRAVRPAEVLSDWACGVSATQLLSRQRGALAMAVIGTWLPAVAETVDRAREHGFAQLGLAPTRWLVSFADLAADERPIDRAALAPDAWGVHYLYLDPLAGFDAELAFTADALERTQISVMQPPLVTAADFLAALARALYELLGGRSRSRVTPLPVLNEPANDLLRDAMAGRTDFATAQDFADAFLSCGRDYRPRV